ncbi:MAG: hypothetical protein JEZ06_18550 [Anaerolineaceae bacterium]|nr:hypothetical protein [Anaerolineaceae bacterium]
MAIVTLLGSLNLTKGFLITPWVGLLKRWLGWGNYLMIFFFSGLGVVFLKRNDQKEFRISLSKILALEAWVFVILTLLSAFFARNLEQVDAGMGGGLIGWGLIELVEMLLPAPFSIVVLILLFIIFGTIGFGLIEFLLSRIDTWLQSQSADEIEALSISDNGFEMEEKISSTSIEKKLDTEKKTVRAQPRTEKLPLLDEDGQSDETFVREEGLPQLTILNKDRITKYDDENIHLTAKLLERSLEEFGIPARVVGFRVGPTVTQFAVEPGFIEKTTVDGEVFQQKIRVSQISNLSKDLSLALSAERLRIEAPVPGHSFVGVEVPNKKLSLVGMRSILASKEFRKERSTLALALGRDVSGNPVVADLAKMPHMLVAGTTGSGKTVCLAAITICLVMNNSPENLRLVMLDPKKVELIRFNGLPHILGQVETEIDRMMGILQWALVEMDNRYRILEASRSRDLDTYNRKMKRRNKPTLPKIVLIVDELADLMMAAQDQTEHSLVRLAQMARATGIHLIVATQRPSTDVVTGLIKANFPSRVSFNVASSIDSRVILDSTGAETLMGKGDMLFLNPEVGSPIRTQGVIISDQEIEKVIEFWQEKDSAAEVEDAPWEEHIKLQEDPQDQLINQAVDIVLKTQRASASYLQRRLRIGYPRAARLVDELEELGVIGPSQGGGREREVLIQPDEENEVEERPNEENNIEGTV